MMITVWYKLFPKLALFMFEQLITQPNFASWKDAKHLCHYVKYRTNILCEEQKEKLIENIVQIMNQQLYRDVILHSKNPTTTTTTTTNPPISWIAKWIPREKSKFAWLYECLVKNWTENFEKTYKNPYKNYRKILTSLNQVLDTTQIKQCENTPNQIHYHNVSLVTKYKNHHYFLQHPTTTNTINTQTKTKTNPSLHYDLGELCRGATINTNTTQMWEKIRENLSKKQTDLFLLPILDMTITDHNTKLDEIAISILLSEISHVQNRIMAYDQTNSFWISLENQHTLSEKILEIEKYTLNPYYYNENHNNHNQNQNNKTKYHYIMSIKCIIKSIIETKLPMNKIERMHLIFISDFSTLEKYEIDHYSLLKSVFYSHGILNIPHIVYWNISNDPIVTKLPCPATTPNVTFLAGTSSCNIEHLLQFSNKSNNNNNNTNPFTFFKNIIDQEKYDLFETYLRTLGNIE